MPDAAFSFTPTQGLRDSTAYPTNPGSEAAARDQIQKGMDQLRDYINSNLLDAVKALSGGAKIQTGSVGVNCTAANVLFTAPVTFPTAFATIPLVFLTVGALSSTEATYITADPGGISKTGFTVRMATGAPQNFGINWIAIGT